MKQRQDKDRMSDDRQRRLNELGFIWDPLEADWEAGFSHLKIYRDRVDHCSVPTGYRENGFRLGQWVGVQRGNKDTLLATRKQRLDGLGFVWDPLEAAWQKGFAALKRFQAREGHCLRVTAEFPKLTSKGHSDLGLGSAVNAATMPYLRYVGRDLINSDLFGTLMAKIGRRALAI